MEKSDTPDEPLGFIHMTRMEKGSKTSPFRRNLEGVNVHWAKCLLMVLNADKLAFNEQLEQQETSLWCKTATFNSLSLNLC